MRRLRAYLALVNPVAWVALCLLALTAVLILGGMALTVN